MTEQQQPAFKNEFVEFWNTTLVPKFTRFQHIMVEGLGQHSRAAFAKYPVVHPGERVLDVGCGFGDTALLMANRVGSAGKVVGLDCCQAFLDFGIAGAAEAGVDNIEWVEGDAEFHEFDGGFDMWFSRFGTMFFVNPVGALRNLKKSLKPDGRMMMIVWRDRADNLWAELPRNIVLEHLPQPEDPATCGPGPFSMTNQSQVEMQLKAAGYKDIEFERNDTRMLVGRNIEEAIDLQLALGPAGEIVREAGELAERKKDVIHAALSKAVEPYVTDEGVFVPASSWCVRANVA